MNKKGLIILVVCLVVFSFQSCKSKPEESLMKSYFSASSMNDIATMSSMALDPMKFDAVSWKIVQSGEEKVAPAVLGDLNQKEIDLKKQFEASSGPALDAQDALNAAKDEYTSARTAGARAAAKAKQDEAQKKYDEAYNANRALVKGYNDAKETAAREEEIMAFSLGVKDLANIRELKGDVASKEIQVEVKNKDGETKNIKILMEKYTMKDEAAGLVHRGRWVITKFETL
ncbi:MAG: hypothetical protein NTW38_13190 [Candidatus Aminicenantes bacterium]|nr:hypothetical protein [Candidatus Aminicenantes bacterium]